MNKDRPDAPDRLYLEQWPEEAGRDDRIFYEQTGYGDDGNGNTSVITVYVKAEERQELFLLLERCQEALHWCGGSGDFNEGGTARVGWQKGVVPVLEKIRELIGPLKMKAPK